MTQKWKTASEACAEKNVGHGDLVLILQEGRVDATVKLGWFDDYSLLKDTVKFKRLVKVEPTGAERVSNYVSRVTDVICDRESIDLVLGAITKHPNNVLSSLYSKSDTPKEVEMVTAREACIDKDIDYGDLVLVLQDQADGETSVKLGLFDDYVLGTDKIRFEDLYEVSDNSIEKVDPFIHRLTDVYCGSREIDLVLSSMVDNPDEVLNIVYGNQADL
jgi:hypothetical protein